MFFVIFVASFMIASAVPFLALCGDDMNNNENTALGAEPFTEPMIAGGNTHSVMLKDDGTVWAWGDNYWRQLGDFSDTNKSTPVQVLVSETVPLSGVISVAAGYQHSLALKEDGTVWAWGYNDKGQIGNSTSFNRAIQVLRGEGPGDTTYLEDVTAIAAGGKHSLAVVDGEVYAWGLNEVGQLGDGTTTNSSEPVKVNGLTDVVMVAAGYAFSLALTGDGKVWAWGQDSIGQLGDGDDGPGKYKSAPVQVKNADDSALDNVISIAAGHAFSLALKADGTVWGWGDNQYRQLGNELFETSKAVQAKNADGSPFTDVTEIAAGEFHSLALKNDGTVWAWGYGIYGQLGDGDSGPGTNKSTPAQVKDVTGDGHLTGVTAIAAGGNHSFALIGDELRTWGSNYEGQLGDGCILMSNTPVRVVGLTGTVTAISIGFRHSLIVMDGEVWAWGRNEYGQLGNGVSGSGWYGTDQATPVRVVGLTDVIAVAAGDEHSLALKSDGTVWAWGNNNIGQLGDGTPSKEKSTPVQVVGLSDVIAIAAGNGHSIALTEDGNVWVWGLNNSGQLGDGTTNNRSTPVQVLKDTDSTVGAGPYLEGVTAIAAGAIHSMALKDDETVWVWGYNSWGLGDGTTMMRNIPVQVLKGESTSTNDYLEGVTAIATGDGHSVALTKDGNVWAWGDNQHGQLGVGNYSNSPLKDTPVRVTGLTGTVTAIAAGGNNSAVLIGDDVWAWGDSSFGQLGTGGGAIRNVTPVKVAGLDAVTATAPGQRYSAALTGDGKVWTLGWNMYGQLGDGRVLYSGIPLAIGSSGGTHIITASSVSSFGSLTAPYAQPDAKTVTVTNTGTESVTLTQPTSSNYVVGTLSKTALDSGETATFTVQPKPDLAAGTYNETITINGSGGASASVSVSFTVNVSLTGIVNLSINPSTGEVTATATGGNTATAGTLTYTWTGGATGTGAAKTPTLGVSATCTVTASGAVGSISANVELYKVQSGTTVDNGTTGTFSVPTTYGKNGDTVTCSFDMGSAAGVAFSDGMPLGLSDGNTKYTINGANSVNGVITITATFTPPALNGEVALVLDPSTGLVTAAASGGNVAAAGTLTYTWTGGTTGTTFTPAVGVSATCTVTASGASGSISGTITVYKVEVTSAGEQGNDAVSMTDAFGEAGDPISIAYVLDDLAAHDTLTYGGVAVAPAQISGNGSGTSTYVISEADAVAGIIGITATFSHDADPPLTGTVNLTVDPATGGVTASVTGGDTGTLTYTWTDGTTGTTFTPALGTPVTCTVTASGASGSISGTITVYKVTSGPTVDGGTTGTFSIATAYGKEGDAVPCAFAAGDSFIVEFASANGTVSLTDGNTTYTIDPADAVSGLITVTAAFVRPIVYPVEEGGSGTWTGGSSDDFVIVVNVDFAEFTGVWVNGNELIKDTDYTAVSGSTIVTLKRSYLQTLSAGPHPVDVYFTDGIATATLTVAASPDVRNEDGNDGGSNMNLAAAAIAAILIVGIAAYFIMLRRS